MRPDDGNLIWGLVALPIIIVAVVGSMRNSAALMVANEALPASMVLLAVTVGFLMARER